MGAPQISDAKTYEISASNSGGKAGWTIWAMIIYPVVRKELGSYGCPYIPYSPLNGEQFGATN